MRFINYQGKKLPLNVSWYAIKNFKNDTGVDLQQVDDKPEYLEILLYYSLKSGHRIEKIQFDYTMEDMENILDESMMAFVAAINLNNSNEEDDGSEKKR